MTLVFHLVLADDLVEDVPMGVFEVSEANRLAKCLELKAYDFMLRFDKSFNGFETVGTAYDFIALCCKRCKVEFANKRAEIDAMPNGGVTLSVYTENDIETCRDVLFYVAQVLGGFFIINREGKLELRKYGKDPVMKVEQRHRFSSSFSDFITRYTAVSSTNKQTQIAEYYALDPDNGLTMNLGVNPLLQFGLKETREMLCRNILTDLSVIRYVPFDSDTIGNPALDLGDVLTFSGGQADAQQITHHCGGSTDAAGLFHLLQAVGGQADFHAVQLLLQLGHAGGQLAAIAHLAGTLTEIPAVGHGVGVAVDELDVQLMAGALLGQHLRTFDGVVVGTGSRAVDAQMHQVGIALVHIALVNLAPLQLGDGGGGGHALGVAHHLVKLVIGEILALHVFHAVQVDGEAHDLDAVLVRKLLRNIGTGIRQKTNLAHFTSSLHS